METKLLCSCPICGRDMEEGKCCELEAWLLRRRELLHRILTGMGVTLSAKGSNVLLVDPQTGHAVIFPEGDGA